MCFDLTFNLTIKFFSKNFIFEKENLENRFKSIHLDILLFIFRFYVFVSLIIYLLPFLLDL